jgi:hypothetical protein
MSLVLSYQGWEVADRRQDFPATQLDILRRHGSIPVLAWYPMDGTIGTVNQTKFTLARIIDGTWDTYIRQYATEVKAWGHPFFLRFASEMNGNWTPWSERVNGNQKGQYVRAWRHVHDIFTQVGATNATWTWCPNVEDTTTTPLAVDYPGVGYVDWACMDGYNFSVDLKGGSWLSFAQIFQATYQHLLTMIPSTMPVMIGEMGSVEQGGSKSVWITDALSVQIPTKYPRIKAVIWFNDTNPGIDVRFDTTPQSLAALRTTLASGAYADNSYRFLRQMPIPPPDDVSPNASSPAILHDATQPAAGYIQVLNASENTPIADATLVYSDGTTKTTDAHGLATMPESAKQVNLQAIGVKGGMFAMDLPLNRHSGYLIQVDLKYGDVISVHVHDLPSSIASDALAKLEPLKTAPLSAIATIGLAILTLLFAITLVMRLWLRARRRRK